MDGLRIAVLVKQVPSPDSVVVGPSGRVRRHDVPLEMSAYCRRALAQGVQMARDTGGSCTVFSLGPPAAELVLREALAFGADAAVLLSDPAFAGSDTLATSRALAALLEREGRFDLILVGRASLDAETGQVGPQLAELLGLPFAGAVRRLHLDQIGRRVEVRCEQDDGGCRLVLDLPAVLAAAERLCPPAKVPGGASAGIPGWRVRRIGAADLPCPGPWGADGSPTQVTGLSTTPTHRAGLVLSGPLHEQVDRAVAALEELGALTRAGPAVPGLVPPGRPGLPPGSGPAVGVVVEPGRPRLAREILGAAATLAAGIGAEVVAVTAEHHEPSELWSWGADFAVEVGGSPVEADLAAAVSGWVHDRSPGVLLAPATFWGREVASRVAARIGAGLVSDVLELTFGPVAGDRVLICSKPAGGGATVARVVCRSEVQLATVRPGVLPLLTSRPGSGPLPVTRLEAPRRGGVQVLERWKDDEVEALALAEVVVGVGAGVDPRGYDLVRRLAALVGAELAATRKVTDGGWMPRSRQVGITGRSVAPRLYAAIGLSGRFNHMAGVEGARTVLAINHDAAAPVFAACDVGIVGSWEEVVPLLVERLAPFGDGLAIHTAMPAPG